MHDNIGYYLQRVRAEIRQAKRAVSREVTIAHFNLADAYLERIHRLFQEIGDVDAISKTLRHVESEHIVRRRSSGD